MVTFRGRGNLGVPGAAWHSCIAPAFLKGPQFFGIRVARYFALSAPQQAEVAAVADA